jgi:hypothetical protein
MTKCRLYFVGVILFMPAAAPLGRAAWSRSMAQVFTVTNVAERQQAAPFQLQKCRARLFGPAESD